MSLSTECVWHCLPRVSSGGRRLMLRGNRMESFSRKRQGQDRPPGASKQVQFTRQMTFSLESSILTAYRGCSSFDKGEIPALI